MSAKTARGEKRKCQNEECLAPFYDLGRDAFECPVCGTEFDHEVAAQALEPQPGRYPSRKQPRILPIVASAEPGESDDDDNSEDELVADVAGDDDAETTTTAEAPEGLLESEDDDDNLANAIEIPATNANDDT